MRCHATGRRCCWRAFGGSLGVWLVLVLTPEQANGIDSISGIIDLRAVQSTVDGVDQSTVRQEYTLHWQRKLVPRVDLRASLRYFKFDLDGGSILSSTREEVQPSAEAIWKHELFLASASGFRRNTRNDLFSGRFITDDLLFSVTTRDEKRPVIFARYEWQHIYDTVLTAMSRDSRDRRLQLGADYFRRANALSYNFTRRLTENEISELRTSRDDHLVRWSAMSAGLAENRLSLQGNYRFTYSSQRDETTGTGTVVEELSIVAGLFAVDASPDLETLDVVAGLSDGNTGSPTVPPIDIGGVVIDRSIGADLGFERPVSALYIHTDRLSGSGLRWRLYVSSDNFGWQLADATPAVLFNVALARYEIEFDPVVTRYIKVVSGGLNEVTEVLVTEVRAFRDLETDESFERGRNVHLFDGRMSWVATDRLDAAAEVTLERESSPLPLARRSLAGYALRGRYLQTALLTHHLRWDQTAEQNGGLVEDLTSSGASYTLNIEPLATLSAALSLSNRRAFLDGQRRTEITAVLAELNGIPVRGLNMSMDVGRNRADDFLSGRRQSTWNARASIDGSFTRSLDAIFSYLYQRTTALPEHDLRIRSVYRLGADYRFTRTIFLRAALDLVDDVRDTFSQDYLVSWNLMPKISLTGRMLRNDLDDGVRTDRYNVNANYYLDRRTTFYLNYTLIDFSEAGGIKTTSLQQGVRATF